MAGLLAASDTSRVDVPQALDGPAPSGAFTLFAPNDAAVQDAPSGLTASQITSVLLYHTTTLRSRSTPPRRSPWTWPEHFAMDGGKVIGLTPAGRATVRLLQMNAPRRVELREAWLLEQSGD